MKICFPDEERQRLFNSLSRLQKKYGPHLASMICRRLALLDAAEHLALIPRTPPIGLADLPASQGVFTVSLGNGQLLYFETADQASSRRRNAAGSNIQHVRILGLDRPRAT